ncbi:MAG: hypothetical protein HON94_06915 [Methylococcales bacterium]|jgi:hypothetical protein|nr:hypothetical protein [Methylococcales bacterium]
MILVIALNHKSSHICWSYQQEVTLLHQIYHQPLQWHDSNQLNTRIKALLNCLPDHIIPNQIIITVPNAVNPIDQKRLFGCCAVLGISVIRVIPTTTVAAFYLMANCTDEHTERLIYSVTTEGVDWGRYEQDLLDDEYQLEVLMTGHDASLSDLKSSFKPHQLFEITDPNASILGATMLAAVLDGRINNRILIDNVHWNFGILANEIRESYICENCCRVLSPVANLLVCRYCHHSLLRVQLPIISAKQTGKLAFYSLLDSSFNIPTFAIRKIWLEKNVTRIPIAVTDHHGKILFTRTISKPIQRGALTSGLINCRLEIDANHYESISFSSPRSHQHHQYPFFICPTGSLTSIENTECVIDESTETVELPMIQFNQNTLSAIEAFENELNLMHDRELCSDDSYAKDLLSQDELDILLYSGINEKD